MNTKKKAKAVPATKERTYLSQSDVPSCSVEKALEIAEAIVNNYGNGPAAPLDVAKVLQVAPNNSDFKMLTGASIAYGFTEGGWNAAQIAVMPLALKVLKPQSDTDTRDGLCEALLKPRVIREFLNKYNGYQVPRDDIAGNVLEAMGVPKDRTQAVLAMILEGAYLVGFLTDIKGKKYVNLKGVVPPAQEAEQEDEPPTDTPVERTPPVPKPAADVRMGRVYISHGKNREFVDPIRQLLKFGQLEAIVSVEQSTVSQSVTQKVMNEMRSCGAAIIHVDSERTLMDPADTSKETVVLNENVLIEIGAAMALYGERYILLVKDGVKLPSNLQGLFEVRHVGDKLDANETIRLMSSINDMKTKPLPS